MDRLRQRADFLAVANGARANSAAFVVQTRRRDDDGPVRVGFTVTKKNGTATERNRIRRRLRELVKRLDAITMRPHSDYVLVGRRAALSRDFATMLDDLRSVLQRLDGQPKNLQPKNLVTRPSNAFSSDVDRGSRDENPSKRALAPAAARTAPTELQTELNDEN
jgi:ribonuclease P protein component